MLGFVLKEALCNIRRNYVGIQIRNHSLGTQEENLQLFCASTIETEKKMEPEKECIEPDRDRKGCVGKENSLEYGKIQKPDHIINIIPKFLGRTIKKWVR